MFVDQLTVGRKLVNYMGTFKINKTCWFVPKIKYALILPTYSVSHLAVTFTKLAFG